MSGPQHIVGIGASAGGLEALERFFESAPDLPGITYIVVQHLSPDYESHMAELLARHTRLPVQQVTQEMPLKRGQVYLIPPAKTLILSGGKFLLTEKDKSALSFPIDTFLRSLAQEAGDQAVGIILSGTGSDGSRGIIDISEAKGLVIAQCEESAKFSGMPESAIHTGVVDLVLDPEAMAPILEEYFKKGLSPGLLEATRTPEFPASALDEIYSALMQRHGINFRHYKSSTVSRRLQRRVEEHDCTDLTEYVQVLRDEPEEINQLFRDLLIGVTRFFRDEAAFTELASKVIAPIVEKEEEQIRIWVPGCASGEEAYTVGMLFLEEFKRQGKVDNFKIFASDAHSESVRTAAEGRFPAASLEDVPDELVTKYFEKSGNEFLVNNQLRRSIIFTEHNLMTAVPFTRLNLITCRNLLIYLEPPAQKKVFSLFHFGLKTGGTLFLGPSESLGELSNEFHPIDTHWKIFQKRRNNDLMRPYASNFKTASSSLRERRSKPAAEDVSSWNQRLGESQLLKAYDYLLHTFMPAGYLVDERFSLVHTFSGGEKYLRNRSGRSSMSILEMVQEDLRSSISGALQQCAKKNKAVLYQAVAVKNEDEIEHLNLTVRPYLDKEADLLAFVITLDSTAPSQEENFVDPSDGRRDLEMELRFTQENLQATVEELETSNEELQATNEELVASNEELQSSNEELHSVNEELDTVNSEYQKKIVELIELTDDTENLIGATDIEVVFLDEEFRIRKTTPGIVEEFRILETDVGRKITDFQHPLNHPELEKNLQWVEQNRQQHETTLTLEDARHFLVRINPYRTKSKLNGFILSLIDITTYRRSEQRVDDLSSLVESSNDAIIGFSFTGGITSWNQGAERLYGYTAEEAEGENALDLIIPQSEAASFMHSLEDALKAEQSQAIEVPRLTKNGDAIIVSQRLSTAARSKSGETQISSIERDITKEISLRSDRDRLAQVLEQTSDFVGICDSHLKVIFINQAGLQMAGLSPDHNLTELSVSDFHPPETLEVMKEHIAHAAEHGSWIGDSTFLHQDKHEIPVSQAIFPHRNSDGEILHFSTILRDLTAEQKAIREIQQAQQQAAEIGNTLTGVVRHFPEMLIVVDVECQPTFLSPDAASFCETHGKNALPLGLGEIVTKAIAKDQSYLPLDLEGVKNLTFPDGAIRSYLPRVNVLHDQDATITGAVITIQDVTEFRMLDEIKTSLIGTVSHQLKNPIGGINMAVGLVLDGSLGEISKQQRVSLENAMRECHRVTSTVKGLLDLTRFNQNDEIPHRTNEKPCVIVTTAIRNNQTVAARYHVYLDSDINLGLPTVNCDLNRILMVLDNLITNAVKHSPGGSTVVVGARKSDHPDGGILFSVQDKGTGIPQKFHNQVFTKFFRVPGNSQSGSGLGLNICKQFVAAHQGDISFTNNEGGGCTFTFRLP